VHGGLSAFPSVLGWCSHGFEISNLGEFRIFWLKRDSIRRSLFAVVRQFGTGHRMVRVTNVAGIPM
jgi:hypothetical protein